MHYLGLGAVLELVDACRTFQQLVNAFLHVTELWLIENREPCH